MNMLHYLLFIEDNKARSFETWIVNALSAECGKRWTCASS